MRRITTVVLLALAAGTLTACNTGAPQGVLPRTDVPPPPSLARDVAAAGAATSTTTQRPEPTTSRRRIDVPDRMTTPRPSSSNAVTPVMTGSGVGAGFRF